MKASLNTTQSVVSRHGQTTLTFGLKVDRSPANRSMPLMLPLFLDLTSSFDCLQHASKEGEVLGDSGYVSDVRWVDLQDVA